MRLSLYQLFLLAWGSGLVLAEPGMAQEIMNQKITLQVINQPVRTILSRLEKTASIQFMYTSAVINRNQRASLQVSDERLADVLNSLLSPLSVNYRLVNDVILLNREPKSTSTSDVLFLPTPNLASLMADRELSGTVTGVSDNKPLTGVSVLLKSTTRGAITDANGMFRLRIPDGPQTIVVSFIGYQTQEVIVTAGQTSLSVALPESNQSLNEVVVVGYGTTKRVNLTGAVSTVSPREIENRPITNATQALQGLAPGVFVNQDSGQPGSDGATIRIRGIGTLNNSNPLVLVDGIEAPISNVDPNDIASISVLKDAASAAIYGSRASNGVILVTTKRGKFDRKPVVTYSGYAGSSSATHLPAMVTNSMQFMELKNEADINSGKKPTFTADEINRYRTIGPNTDWLHEIFRPASIQQHNLSVNGGSANTSFLLSVGYLNQDGITPNTNYKRYNTRLNIDSKLNTRLSVGASLFLTRGASKAPVSGLVAPGGDQGIVAQALKASPLFPVYDSQGNLAATDQSFASGWAGFGNPFIQSAFNRFSNNRDQLLGSFYAQYELLEGLQVRGTFAVNYQTNNSESFSQSGTVYDWVSGKPITPAVNQDRYRSVSFDKSLNLTTWLQANYTKTFGLHNLAALVGFNQESAHRDGFSTSRTKFPSNVVQVLGAGNASTAVNAEFASEWALRSFFGRLTYNFNEKYLAEVNLRRDGSSRFGANNRWGTFPSVSAGWIVSGEPFMKRFQAVDLLKLRASWGQLGNQYAQGTDYPFAAQVALNANYDFGGNVVSGAAQTTFDNPNIRWETSTSTNIGANLGLWNKLTVEADYFIRTTKDILYALPVPATAGGLANPVVNTAKVRNRGWEVITSYNDRVGDFTFGVGFNITHVRSQLLQISPDGGDQERVVNGTSILQRGAAINSIYGLKALGIFQSQAEIDAAPKQFGGYAPGDLRYEDVNGDGKIDDTDRVIIGKEDPTWLYGANLSAGFKGFDFSALVQGVADFQSYAGNEYYSPFFNNAGLGAQWLDRWTPHNPTAFPRLFFATGPNVNRANSFWVQDRSYLRLKNIQIGYSLPTDLIKRIGFQKVRVYVNAQNLLTITKFQGFDPERPQGQARGGAGYPVLRIVSGGLNITF